MPPDRESRVEQIWHAALALDGAEREAFLADACADDEMLRREVESLLRQQSKADGFLSEPAMEAAAHRLAFGLDHALIGRQLGAYRVHSLLGAGGMGEVYRARDTTLGRDVALKVLPAMFTADRDRLARFEREARMLATLNHPHIGAIYGLEEHDGVRLLVLEIVEGSTLADRLATGPLPLTEALGIARQIAEALEAAHEKGIVHRDLKPANIKITPGGVVKVLDFGLAKAGEGEAGAPDLTQSPTMTVGDTGQGVILGTAAYMSPEQARGQVVDKRTDIWAFGCVLYEALTGRVAFTGNTVSDIIVAILRGEPEWNALPLWTPVNVRLLLQRCLEKDVKRRLRDIGDARIELDDLGNRSGEVQIVTPPPEARRPISRAIVVTVAALVLLAAGLGLFYAILNLRPTAATTPQPVTRFVITLPPAQKLGSEVGIASLARRPLVAVSPDGRYLAYAATSGSTMQIFLRAMESGETTPIAGTEGATSPFFSPDSLTLGFITDSDGAVKKVSLSGGASVLLSYSVAGATSATGATWGRQGTIIIGGVGGSGLDQVPDTGEGTSQQLTRLDEGEQAHRWPDVLPDGNAILFARGNDAAPRIAIRVMTTGETRNLLPSGTYPRYARSGHLLYAQGTTLMAVPFDPQQLKVTGAAIPVVDDVFQYFSGATVYAISNTGTLVYVSGQKEAAHRQLVWVTRNGTEQPLSAPALAYGYPRLSPDGTRLAVELDNQIWLHDLARDTLTRFTFEGGINQDPEWTPDGKRIAFRSDREGPQNLFWQLADGSGGLERLSTGQFTQVARSWSGDGQFLTLHENNPKTGKDIWVVRAAERKAYLFLRTPFIEGAPTFSPDGKWIAYVSNESGRPEIYVQPHPGPGGKWQVSTDGGTEPAWPGSGRELFYRSGKKMIAVPVTMQGGFSAGKPAVLFESDYEISAFPATGVAYDVTPDGQRFLMVKNVTKGGEGTRQINVVLNWFEELNRRVPAAR